MGRMAHTAAPFFWAHSGSAFFSHLRDARFRRPSLALTKELYRELKVFDPRPVDLKLIPYYAWGNRGTSEMTVWMPLGR